MGEASKIQWTDHTFNPWWGCEKVSPGCKHCYAEQFADKRFHLKVWGAQAERRIASNAMWAKPLKWNAAAAKKGQRARVFCASMADVFEKYEGPSWDAVYKARLRLWQIIAATPHLDWLLLTKRPQNVLAMVPGAWLGFDEERRSAWPGNVWVGCTVENQEQATKRIPWLLNIPAPVRFLSCEPLLEYVDLTRITCLPSGADPQAYLNALTGHIGGPDDVLPHRINWVIIGGESGSNSRSFNPAWADGMVSQCRSSKVPVFVKQFGSNPTLRSGSGWGCVIGKGDNPDEWPMQLRIRQIPNADVAKAL